MQWLWYPSPRELICNKFLHVCVCVRVRVCVGESMRVCLTLTNSPEICVVIQKLAKTSDLGRVMCGDFGCYCVFDACRPLPPRVHFTS